MIANPKETPIPECPNPPPTDRMWDNVYYCFKMLSFRVICFTTIGHCHEMDDTGAGKLRLVFIGGLLCGPFPLGPNFILQLWAATNATCILNKLYLDTNRHNRKYRHRYRFFFLYRMNKHHIRNLKSRCMKCKKILQSSLFTHTWNKHFRGRQGYAILTTGFTFGL